ncbi:MAG: TetR/AcrR family transcriptional regulator [Microbacterium sp.]|uniref:TetR family transcriptional regulator n=1 Tax=Microbacterium sp. TaxID=51671 RepID=UPI0039E48257
MSRSTRNPPRQERSIATREALLVGAAAVFARMSYAEARLRDISEESGISEGSLYFHFGNKNEIAAAVLNAQQERMSGVLTQVLGGPGDGLRKLRGVIGGLAELIATDVIVQAGIKLASQPTPELASAAHDPYVEWVRIARTLIGQGIDDGSISADLDVDATAEFLNAVFVGEQVLSEFADSWASLPSRIQRVEPFLLDALTKAHRTA